MADEDKIVQEIDVEVNTEDSESSFDKLKEAAKKAFEQIKELASDIGHADNSEGFDKLESAGTKAFDEIKKAAEGAMAALKQIFTASSNEFGLFNSIKEEGKGAFAELKAAGTEALTNLKGQISALG